MLEYVSEPDPHPLYMFHAVTFRTTVKPHERPDSLRHACEQKPWEKLHHSHRFYSDFHREAFDTWKDFDELVWGMKRWEEYEEWGKHTNENPLGLTNDKHVLLRLGKT